MSQEPVKLTKTIVDRTPIPAAGQAFVRDTQLKGFGLRITPSGAKSFIVEKRIAGKVRRMTIGRFGELTVEQARREATKLLGQVATGVDPVAEKQTAKVAAVTLGEAYQDFLKARKELAVTTLRDYNRVMQTIFLDWQKKRLVTITRGMVAIRHQQLGEERGPAYANLAMRVLRAVMNFAQATYADGHGNPILIHNPVAILSQTRSWYRVQRRQTVIKAHQLPAWFRAVDILKSSAAFDHAWVASDLLRLLLFTGLRKQEALSLRWDAVDLREKTFTLTHTKNHEPLTLPMSDYVEGIFQDRLELAVNDYVFPGKEGEGHLVEPKRQVAHVVETSGVAFTLHDLRRTFITIAESLDIPMFAIKRLVNHKMSGDVTAGYIVSDVERLRDPMQRITDRLIELTQQPLPVGTNPDIDTTA